VLPLGLSEYSQGAFAEAFPVREADFNCVKLPDDVGFTEMAGLGCRFMTAYHALADRANLRPGDWVAVHGCGGVGLSAIHIADALGAHPIAIDLVDDKLERAEELGAGATVNVTEVDSSAQAVQEITGRRCGCLHRRTGRRRYLQELGQQPGTGVATCRSD